MTSASVKNAGLDAGMLTFGNVAKNTQHVTEGQDFGKIMSQAKENSKTRTQKPDATNTAKPDVKSKPKEKTSIAEQQDESQQPVENVTPMAEQNTVQDNQDTVQEVTGEETSETMDSELVKTVEEAVETLLDTVGEKLDVSQEELAATLEQLGLQPVDLLNSNDLTQLLAAVNGEESPIELVTNADLYQQLQELTQAVGEVITGLMEDTGLQEESLEAVLEQLKNLETQAALQEQGAQKDNIPELLQPDEVQPDKAVDVNLQDETVPVIVTEDKAPQQSAQPIPEVEEMAQNVAETQETEDEHSGNQEEDSLSGNNQNNLQNFQNNVEEQQNVAVEDNAIPTRTTDTESILKQLADYVKVQNGKELTEMELQLHPASLGSVHIQLATKGGTVTAQITTQNETVKNAIESQVVQLKQNLEEQGVKVEAVEVSVASHQMEKNLDQSGQEQQNASQDKTTGSIRRIRRANINLNLFNNGEDALEEADGLDDATRIAMEMMAANGNTMDLLA